MYRWEFATTKTAQHVVTPKTPGDQSSNPRRNDTTPPEAAHRKGET